MVDSWFVAHASSRLFSGREGPYTRERRKLSLNSKASFAVVSTAKFCLLSQTPKIMTCLIMIAMTFLWIGVCYVPKAEVWNWLHVNRAKYTTKEGNGFEARNTSTGQTEIPRDLSKKGHSTIINLLFCFHIIISLSLPSYTMHELRNRNTSKP